MKRYHDELPRTQRVYEAHQRRMHHRPGALFPCTCDRQVGHFRKHRAFGCERLRCPVCKVGKTCGTPTTRELRQRDLANASICEWREAEAVRPRFRRKRESPGRRE